jgi:hypothetical protein
VEHPDTRKNHSRNVYGTKSIGCEDTRERQEMIWDDFKTLDFGTLNQRVQGSSPCAPTIEIKHLAEKITPDRLPCGPK